MPINNATPNLGFNHIDGNDTAGHNSINGLITDIDTKIGDRVAEEGMVIIFDSTTLSPAGPPSGWSDFTSSMTSSGVTLPSGYIWIRKDPV